MKVVIQRSKQASVTVEGQEIGSIESGLVVFLGITHEDTEKDIDFLVNKIVNLRVFPGDGSSGFDRSVFEEEKEVLVVSQFTLYGSCNKGRRYSRSGRRQEEWTSRPARRFKIVSSCDKHVAM